MEPLNRQRNLFMQHPRHATFFTFLILPGTLLTAVLLLLTAAQAQTNQDCRDLVRNHCASCHFVTYICPGMEQGKGRWYWRGMVKDMVKKGMVTTREQDDQLIRCLTRPDAAVREFCPAQK
jgi:hypothetical protein